MRYSIGEFSELIGLTPDTLRLYEKYHIVNPVKDPNNGYRYYDDLDVRNLLACRRFRSFDFPLEIAAELTVSPNIDRLNEALRIKQSEIESEINRLECIKSQIHQTISTVELAYTQVQNQYLSPIIEVELQGIYRLIQTNENTLSREIYPYKHDISKWMEALPDVMYSFKTELQKDSNSTYTWGMAIEESKMITHNLISNDYLEYLPTSNYLKGLYLAPNSEYMSSDIYLPLIEYAKVNDLVYGDFVWGKLISTINVKNQNCTLMEVYLKVSKKVSGHS